MQRHDLKSFLPSQLESLTELQTALPKLVKYRLAVKSIESAVGQIPTTHKLYRRDSREVDFLASESVHLVLTSPPYWTLKQYRSSPGQMGEIADYEMFITELDRVWRRCYEALVPGGRLICVVGDVCLSRKKNGGQHSVMPLHASIQEHCRKMNFKNLAPIIWYKISNAKYEVENGGGFLGKPYEPNGIVKNDIEYILMERKAGAYRKVSDSARILSLISHENHKKWFQQIWADLPGASTKQHPAPFPIELAERLIRMFSFVGDVVLDPFMGTGTTNLAAAKWARNSIGIEIDEHYFDFALKRLKNEAVSCFNDVQIESFQ